MAIKSKKSRPFLVWVCFIIGLNLLISIAFLGLGYGGELYHEKDELANILMKGDLKETRWFKSMMAIWLDGLIQEGVEQGTQDEALMLSLKDQGTDLYYYVRNAENDLVISNATSDMGFLMKGMPSLPQGYDYAVYFNGREIFIEREGQAITPYDDMEGYGSTVLVDYLRTFETSEQSYENINAFLLVKADLSQNPSYGLLYSANENIQITRWVAAGILMLIILGAGLIIFSIFNWQDKKVFEKNLLAFFSRQLLEVKGIVTVIMLGPAWFVVENIGGYLEPDGYVIIAISMVTVCWWFWMMVRSIKAEPKAFFHHHTVNLLIGYYRRYEKKKPFQKAMLLRAFTLIAVEIPLIFMATLCFYLAAVHGNMGYLLCSIVFVGLGVYLAYRYLRRYACIIADLGALVDQLSAVKNGDVVHQLALKPDADLYEAAENLNQIQSGVTYAAEARLKSERMKVELVTNVSHDLKTPLTSIISYVDLLLKEEDLPEHVQDYVQVLNRKSERLKVLIQDLFDLSKAVSGEMEFQAESLNLGKLIEQTLGDLNQEIQQASLTYRVNLPEPPVMIYSDGDRLYRVFLNLLVNTLKYSLADSRVYVELTHDQQQAAVVIKNTANYEINFNEEEIIERFARGDKARTTEGSGLGLAIAESFTKACGGKFKLQIDGDLFKVTLTFPLLKHNMVK